MIHDKNNTAKQNKPIAAQQGLVISYFGSSVAVEAADGQVFQCHLHRNQDLPVVGDRVLWQQEHNDNGTIISILPRDSTLIKGDSRGKTKPIAANLNLMLIVMAPPPIFSQHLVDRYLVAAELLAIPAAIVLNKADLLNHETRPFAEAQLKIYRDIHYPVFLSSVYAENGLLSLTEQMRDKTSVLVGPSGVGKSSIIAALCKNAVIRVGDVSPKGAGKHTTTATRLYHLDQGGTVIDSPGVREFNLWPVAPESVLTGFKELNGFNQGCKFRDCLHDAEPGCLIKKALADNKIHQKRYESYQALLKELRIR